MGIRDYKVGQEFSGSLLVKSASKRKAANGNNYIALNLGDKTGDVQANIWSPTEDQEEIAITGAVLHIEGTINDFRGNKQINIKSFVSAENVNIGDLLMSAPINGNEMLTKIVDEIKAMENSTIQTITFELLKKHAEKFKTHPAAERIHHSYVSGLAYHTYSMLLIGKSMCELYPILNKDLLLAGIILHDIGKIKEYTGYMGTSTTLEGKLKGHISIISEEIKMVAEENGLEDDEETLLLQHMVLSHHGIQENGWGSAVSPLTIEANILHRIDTIDAEMDMYKAAIEETDVGDFTQKLWGMDMRAFYNHGMNDK